MGKKLKAAIITENHPIDVLEFHKLVNELEDFDCYVQSLDLFVADEKNQDTYDVVVYYNLSRPALADDSKIRKYFEEKLGSTKQGIFLLHHALLCYPTWDLWTELTGIEDRRFKYHWDQTVKYDIANSEHPITEGLKAWAMLDETYELQEPKEEGTTTLITAEHPLSIKNIAWTRQYKNSRIFCYASGHDDCAYNDTNFKEVLKRGMLWCANQI